MDFLEQGPAPLFTSWSQVTIFVVAIGAVIKWLWPMLKNRGNGTSSRASTPEAVANLQRALDALTVAVGASNLALGTLNERIANLPTRLDLAEQFEKSRHDMRNIIAPLLAAGDS